MRAIITNNEKETKCLAAGIAQYLKKGDIVALIGNLGSGKTTFTKGLAEGLDVKDPEHVNSPSFVLIKEYKGRIGMYHFDLYRLDNICDIEYIGIQDYLDNDGVVVIEWADKIRKFLTQDYLQVEIGIIDACRREIMIKGHGKRYDNIINRYVKPQV